MSILEQKSIINCEAAYLLQESGYYCSVVPAAYYSCVQLMKHIVLSSLGKTEDQFNSEREAQNHQRRSARKKTLGTHEYLIDVMVVHLRSCNKSFATFNNDINQLKLLRVKADYLEEEVTQQMGANSVVLCESVLNCLR